MATEPLTSEQVSKVRWCALTWFNTPFVELCDSHELLRREREEARRDTVAAAAHANHWEGRAIAAESSLATLRKGDRPMTAEALRTGRELLAKVDEAEAVLAKAHAENPNSPQHISADEARNILASELETLLFTHRAALLDAAETVERLRALRQEAEDLAEVSTGGERTHEFIKAVLALLSPETTKKTPTKETK